MNEHCYISDLTLNEKTLLKSEKYTVERLRAMTDIMDHNQFELHDATGPYRLEVSIEEFKCRLCITDSQDKEHLKYISLNPLRRVIKDYHIVCESYVSSVQHADPSKVEAIDMGRRSLHNEAAEILEDLLVPHVTMDFETSRKLFTLIYVLQLR